MAADTADTVLSDVHIAVDAASVSVHSDVLTVCSRGVAQAWAAKRTVAGYEADLAMQARRGERV